MHSIHRRLPAEILEAFIDELGRASARSELWHALQQCALVSRVFRNRANHHLFSHIEFVQRPYSSPSKILSRLWKLRDIIEKGNQKLSMTGLLYHIRSFKLVMDGSIFDAHTVLENEDLVAIMRSMQDYSKDLEMFTMRQGSSFPILWPDLTLEFRSVFKNLCRNSPSLTTLSLENIVGVPHTLLMHTNIKHVRFHLIDFQKPRMAFVIFREGYLPKGQLESIDIDYTFPFPPTSLIETRLAYEDAIKHYQNIFCRVKKLCYLIYRSDDLERFVAVARGIASSLEVVALVLSNSDNSVLRAPSWEIPLADLRHLRHMVVHHKALVSASARHPLLKVATLLQSISVPQSLETLELSFEVSAQAPWLKPTHFFPEPKIWMVLDEALTNKRFNSVTNIIVNVRYCITQEQPWTFDEAVFVTRCREFVKGVFPLLSGSKLKALELVVSFASGLGDESSGETQDQ